jgi:hypothetical protein
MVPNRSMQLEYVAAAAMTRGAAPTLVIRVGHTPHGGRRESLFSKRSLYGLSAALLTLAGRSGASDAS